jgi:radical SAM superfamily enzyme YgiQ (UPF0313 family)
MDSDQFHAAPTTTGGLQAYYRHYGRYSDHTCFELLHFADADAIEQWQRDELLSGAKAAMHEGLRPVFGFSFYTWNAAEFLTLCRELKAACPGALVIAGGPHVQEAGDYLLDEAIDLIALGEGEATFSELLDSLPLIDQNVHDKAFHAWQHADVLQSIDGLAWACEGAVHCTNTRRRETELDRLPSALEVVPLLDAAGRPLYESISYETSRGCPFTCAFCEWGTGAIGSKMVQFSMARIKRDWQKIIEAGIKNIWLADSNFGALKTDIEKAQLICELKQRTGLPSTFATSWSKKHSSKVQEIVLMLHRNGLLPHYQLALQTLTPLALELSNRKNMAANKYEPIAREMAAAGVPIAAELIWGLPGDNLPDFERNLDKLLSTFPNINIFGYTLLPGTEFYEKRDEYQIDAIPVAGYGKAKGEYVVGCHTFDREQGIEGYFLIAAHMILIHGHIMPLTVRYLAMRPEITATPLLRIVLRGLLAHFQQTIDGMDVYEQRANLYLLFMQEQDTLYAVIGEAIREYLVEHPMLGDSALKVLALDKAICPRTGAAETVDTTFDFDAQSVLHDLSSLDLPGSTAFDLTEQSLCFYHPGGVGDVLHDPDGGSWLAGQLIERAVNHLNVVNIATS